MGKKKDTIPSGSGRANGTSIKIPAEIMADIEEASKPATFRKMFPPEVVEVIKVARAKGAPWAKLSLLLKKHYPEYGLCASGLMQRNKIDGWGA